MNILYFECNMGAAGDMLMASLYELLSEEQKQEFLKTVNALCDEIAVEPLAASSKGIAGTRMEVGIAGTQEMPGEEIDLRSASGILQSADAQPGEGHPHESDPEHVHTHGHVHTHDQEHMQHHDHDQGQEHACDHGHTHMHDHDHDHMDDQEHPHGHDHSHAHGHEYAHPHDHDHDHAHGHHHSHTAPAQISRLIEGFALPEEVKGHAQAVYAQIAAAESRAHGIPVTQIHFHEVGDLDAVIDITGVCLAIHLLSPDRIVSSPIHLGSGEVRCAHGVVPVPAPATAYLLEGVPCYTGKIRGELCTPTGAALLAHFAQDFGPMPVMKIRRYGYGIGKKEFPAANLVRTFYGELC